jgi:hypothetical protein
MVGIGLNSKGYAVPIAMLSVVWMSSMLGCAYGLKCKGPQACNEMRSGSFDRPDVLGYSHSPTIWQPWTSWTPCRYYETGVEPAVEHGGQVPHEPNMELLPTPSATSDVSVPQEIPSSPAHQQESVRKSAPRSHTDSPDGVIQPVDPSQGLILDLDRRRDLVGR